VDFDAMYHNPDTHQHCNHAIDHEQYDASLTDRCGKYILIENEFENLATTSRIYHLLTVQNSENKNRIVNWCDVTANKTSYQRVSNSPLIHNEIQKLEASDYL
jgi:hypothetical protein